MTRLFDKFYEIRIPQWRAVTLVWAICLALVNILGSLIYAIEERDSTHGDWLVTFSDGYSRRGFSGETVYFISSALSTHPKWVVVAIQILVALVFSGIALYLARMTFGFLPLALMVFFPMGFSYILNDPGIAGRKDFLFLTTALIWLISQSSKGSSANRQVLRLSGFTLAFFVVFSFHEGFVFFVPLLLVLSSYLSQAKEASHKLFQAIPPALAGGLTLLLNLSASMPSPAEICARAMSAGYSSSVCEGSTLYFQTEPRVAVLENIESYSLGRALPYLLFLGIFVTLMIKFQHRYSNPSLGSIRLIIGISSTLPIYVLGTDWGRWLSVTIVLLTCSLILSLKISPSELDIANSRPLGLRAKISLLLFSLCWCLGWGVAHHSPVFASAITNFIPAISFIKSVISP